MFSGMLAGFLKVAAVAVVTGGFVGGIYWAVQVGGSEDSSPFVQAATTLTMTITPQSTAVPTATEQPPPTDPPAPSATALPTVPPPAPTADTRVPIRDVPTVDQIQLGKDGKYFIADRGDGCTWVEHARTVSPDFGEEIVLATDCPIDFAFVYRIGTGEIFPLS